MTIRLESPFPAHALPRAWLWMESFRTRVADDFSPKTLEEFMAKMLNPQPTEKTWGVYRDEELGGIVSFQRLSPWLGTAHCVFKPAFWGWATTVPALRVAFDEIFAGGVGKLTFPVFANNKAVIALIVTGLGGYREGVLKQHTVRDGEPVDMLVCRLTKGEYEKGKLNAIRDTSGTAHLVGDRGGIVDSGQRIVEPQEDRNHNTNAVA